jgi:hypothetical protein|tara:strand:+ start:486 stop:776 length:291 start_codon:yes stop_codon:yes gene_type:complete
MFQVDLDTSIGNLGVQTTQYRGHTPQEFAKMASDRIVSISDDAPEPIRQQAHAFKDYLEVLLADYMQKAVEGHICTICNLLEKQGHRDMAEIIRRL